MQEFLKENAEGDILEYPVYEVHIRNRGLRLDMFKMVAETEKPRINDLKDMVVKGRPIKLDDGTYKQNWLVKPKSEGMLRNDMKAELANVRWQHEVGGITLPDGTKINTDREDQNNVNKAYTTLKDGLQDNAEFKAAEGWVTVDLAGITPIARAIAQHVQLAFKAERTVSEQLDALDNDSLRQLSVSAEYQQAYATHLATALAG